MTGWFAVKRGITSHHLFNGHPERLAVWIWLLDNAVWKDTTHDIQGKTITVKRGSVCASERHIAKQVGVGYQVVRTALQRFKTEHMVNADLTHGKNVITLCNYEKYQDPEKAANAQVNASLTQEQRKANAQKKQVNNITRDTNVSQDAEAIEILASVVSQPIATAFAEHRRGMGKAKALTVNAAKAMVKKLDGHHDPGAVLNDSIANGWQGIFPEKTRPQLTAINGGSNNGQPASKSAKRIQAWTQGARGTFEAP